MADIEQLEIHSKSYIVRWVKVEEGQTISWSVQPHKKSINFGIVKHPGTGGTNLTTFQSEVDVSQLDGTTDAKPSLFARRDATTGDAPDQLRKKGFKLVDWHGKCDADKVSIGTYDVLPGNGGMFGLVFDNTFSKQTSKNATFVLLTYPTGAPPQGARNLPNLQAGTAASTSRSSLGKHSSPHLSAVAASGSVPSGSVDSLHSHLAIAGAGGAGTPAGASTPDASAEPSTGSGGPGGGGRSRSSSSVATPQASASTGASASATGAGAAAAADTSVPPTHHVGILLKRRRKKGQGYARRYFSLDYATCTLSYYHNRNSSALRGAVPLSLAAIAADERRRELTIDSGAEVWHLKASNAKDFTDWARALERASRIARGLEQPPPEARPWHEHAVRPILTGAAAAVAPDPGAAAQHAHLEDLREWQQAEALVSRVVGTRDALRRLVKDMAANGSGSNNTPHHPLHSQTGSHRPAAHFRSSATPSVSEENEDYFGGAPSATPTGSQPAQPERRSFWRRRTSASPLGPQNGVRPAVASSSPVPTPPAQQDPPATAAARGGPSRHHPEERSMQDHCQALLSDLDSVVTEFTRLLAKNKHRRTASAAAVAAVAAGASGGSAAAAAASQGGIAGGAVDGSGGSVAGAGAGMPRRSFDSTSTDEFFDANELVATDRPQLLLIGNSSEGDGDDSPASFVDEVSIHDDGSSESSGQDVDEYSPADMGKTKSAGGAAAAIASGDGTGGDGTATGKTTEATAADGAGDDNDDDDGAGDSLFPPKPKSLAPLPILETVARRTTVPRATVQPPSLIAFVRKNVGKDLSTISMPVSANEPTSLLQRTAEQLEYAALLEAAATRAAPAERLAYVAAFAVSQFAAGRAKERAVRKPFNPLLGETYELLRTARERDPPGSMRVLVEKVSHRPVRLAIQADAPAWSLAQAAAPSQKFWGKSAEVITEGRVRVVLRLPDGGGEEHYSWALATVFLRNVVMGEKYVEPVGTMHVANDSTGARAAVEFRSKGMFGGRSEDVQVETYDAAGQHAGVSLTGTWTAGLRMTTTSGTSTNEPIWRVGPLADDAPRAYGLTRFAAQLNEITALEQGRLPPTDCRLRPDQRLAENGQLDEAEAWKTRLEEAQRARRRAREERGEEYRPRWFVKVATGPDGDEVWRLKTGPDGYWEERARGAWTGVEEIFSG